MKFYPSITKNEIPDTDFKAWHYLSSLMKDEPEKGKTKKECFEKYIEL